MLTLHEKKVLRLGERWTEVPYLGGPEEARAALNQERDTLLAEILVALNEAYTSRETRPLPPCAGKGFVVARHVRLEEYDPLGYADGPNEACGIIQDLSNAAPGAKFCAFWGDETPRGLLDLYAEAVDGVVTRVAVSAPDPSTEPVSVSRVIDLEDGIVWVRVHRTRRRLVIGLRSARRR